MLRQTAIVFLPQRLLSLLILAWLLIHSAGDGLHAAVQEQEAEAPAADDDAQPQAPEVVRVTPQARDDQISQRLTGILESTEWFDAPQARADNGVVFLSGTASKEEYRLWASELARNTQDVAAVVNRIQTQAQSIWDFSGALGQLRDFQAGSIQALPYILFGLVLLIITWLVAKLAGRAAQRLFKKRIPNNLLRWVVSRAIMLPIVIFGIYLILRVSGLTQLALTVIGGTGLVGLIIGIAFQDIAENFLASVLISVQQPFRIGDLIRVGEHEGIVDRVTTRGTTILTADGNHVQIPNSQIYKNTIVNYTANPLRRIRFLVGIGYTDAVSHAQEVILRSLREHTATLNDPPPKVLVDQLGAATVSLEVMCWIDATKNDWFAVRSSVMRKTKLALQQHGVSMPDEAREVLFPQGVPVVIQRAADTRPAEKASMPSVDADPGAEQQLEQLEPVEPVGLGDHVAPVQEQDVTEAEGNLLSEADELKRQADQSWNPDKGQEIVMSDVESVGGHSSE